jgi:thiol-disulfide isomerase/thioredoxin
MPDYANAMNRALISLIVVAFCAMARAAAPGEPAPALSLTNAAGQTVSLSDLRGKVVYIDFWASWCAPCKRSFPWMNAMQQKYGDKGLSVLAVNVDRKREDAAKFLAATPARFTVLYDPDGRTPAAWQVKAMPSSYLVDAQGRIALVETGFRDERKDEVEARIRAALEAR